MGIQSVLADADHRAQSVGKFSLASEIVELLVLTGDDTFLKTLREAVGRSRRLWHVPTGDKVGDLLVAGQVGILVLDVNALIESSTVFITQIKRQFPDLVVVVAGNRDVETALASLISDGTVYRFIHKPMSPGRAKLFADAAVKKYGERDRCGTATSISAPHAAGHGRLLAGLGIGGAAALAAIFLLATGGRHGDSATTAAPSKNGAAASALLARAAAALAANRLTTPSDDNALDWYSQALARDPTDASARAGVADVHERLLARAENALLEERLDQAAAAIDAARKAGVDRSRIAFLSAQLAKSRLLLKSVQTRARAKLDSQVGAARSSDERLIQALSMAAERTQEERLIEPEGDSARFYVEQALRIDPQNAAAQDAEESLALRLLAEARSAIERRNFDLAAAFLRSASGIAAAPNIEHLEELLREAESHAQSSGG